MNHTKRRNENIKGGLLGKLHQRNRAGYLWNPNKNMGNAEKE